MNDNRRGTDDWEKKQQEEDTRETADMEREKLQHQQNQDREREE
jgi:hypothetical protein